MKKVNYKVILKSIKYDGEWPDVQTERTITFGNINEVLEKFPLFREKFVQDAMKDRNKCFLKGDVYNGIYLESVVLTYSDIDKERPSEQELRNYYKEQERQEKQEREELQKYLENRWEQLRQELRQ